jgi:hypothetical protein
LCPAMNVEDLIAAAKAAPAAHGRRNTDRWLPVVVVLRGKGYTYAQIRDFLEEKGEDVHPSAVAFASAMSRRYRHWLTSVALDAARPDGRRA